MSAEPTITGLLEKQIETLGENLNQRLNQQDRAADDFKHDMRQALARIEGKVDKTNGRVTTLEKARERAKGVIAGFAWLPPILASVFSAGLTILVMALSGNLH